MTKKKQIKKSNKIYIRTGFVLIAIGILGLAFPFLSLGFLSDFAFLNTIAENNGSTLPIIQPTDRGSSISHPNQNSGEIGTDYERKSTKDRLAIPVAKINMPLFQSDNIDVLFKGGWLFPGTSTPEKIGNTVIFGHRFRYLPPISNTFYHLDEVKIGDSFTITWENKTYNYRVSEVKIIEPTDLSVIQTTTDSRVTLITCAPLFSTKQRLVVIGQLQP